MFQKRVVTRAIMAVLLCTQLSSCNYLAGFIGNGLAGLITYPLQRLVEAFQDGTDDFYEREMTDEQRRQLEEGLRLINHCRFVEGTEFPEDFEGLTAALEQRQCLACVPWGQVFECNGMPDTRTEADLAQIFGRKAIDILPNYSNLTGNCCSESCSNRCERMCPESAEIMAQARRNAIPYRENTLPMENSAEDMSHPEEHDSRPSSIDAPAAFNGVCHGHSTVRARLAALGQFDDPNQAPRVPMDGNGRALSGERLDEFYADVLRDLARGKVREVPGYSNLRDFTSRPGIAPVLRAEVLRSFHNQVARNPFLVESAAAKFDFDREKYQESMQDIRRSIAVSGTAQVTFGFDSGGGHTVEVYKVHETTKNGRPVTKMCIIDSNKNVCTYDYSQPGAPCVSNGDDYDTMGSTHSSGEVIDGTYCPRVVTAYNDDYSYDFPGHRGNTGNSFVMDRQQDRNARTAIKELSKHCKAQRGCR